MLTDIVCSGGVVLKYDTSIQAGDIVTGYHKGYWKVIKVVPREGSTPSIYYKKIGTNSAKSCDGSYCRKVDPHVLFDEMVAEAAKIRDMILKAQGEA